MTPDRLAQIRALEKLWLDRWEQNPLSARVDAWTAQTAIRDMLDALDLAESRVRDLTQSLAGAEASRDAAEATIARVATVTARFENCAGVAEHGAPGLGMAGGELNVSQALLRSCASMLRDVLESP